MKYLCVNCNFIYDESLGDKAEGIKAGTKIDFLEYCPVCDEYDTFHHIKEEVIYMEEGTRDKYELGHFIEVEKKDGKIVLTIGDNTHPMTEDHRICWIGMFDEYGDLVEERFLGVDADSSVEFEDYDLDEFEVRLKCSEHNLFGRKFNL